MRVIFMGTPEFGVPILNSILGSRHTVIAAVCQPDRPGNRREMKKPPVKVCAEYNGIQVMQFDRVSREGLEAIKSLKSDIMVTAAFGQILSDELLTVAPHGVINVHASLLPKYRGSSPVHRAILNGESYTGVTIMQTAHSVDSGDIIMQERINILPDETTGELTDRLSMLGAEMIVKALDSIEDGSVTFTPQNHSEATHYPMLHKEDGRISWNMTAREAKDFIRGMQPWPSAYANIDGATVKLLKAQIVEDKGAPGEIITASRKDGLIIALKTGAIRIIELQPEGKKPMFSNDYLLGHPIKVGTVLC